MAAISRLQQRIKENFQETTRDISLLAGGGGSATAAYFDTSDEKIKEISKLLESRLERERLEGMKRIIAGMSKGRDMEPFFAQVVKNVVAPSIEIRKLVYIYLLRFASTNSDLLLLSINTFQKDLSDSSPLIRSMSLRVLTSIRVPVIQGIVMLGLKKLVNDRNPYVRKVVAGGLAKVYEMDTSALSQLLPLLQTLLASPSPLTLGPTLTAFLEMCPDRLDLLHPYYRHICRLIVDADEWGQCVALEVLTRYARTMLEKPETAGSVNPSSLTKKPKQVQPVSHPHDGEDSEDEFEGLDIDLAMLLHCSKPLFQSRNPAVVLATATMFYHLAPAGHALVGQELLVAPLLRLASGSDRRRAAGEEIAALTWEVVAGIAEERPWLLSSAHSLLYLHSSDSVSVKLTKIKVLTALISAETAQASVCEFKHYTRDQNDAVAEAAVKAIGHCVRTQSEVAVAGLSSLMRLLKSDRGCLVAQAVIVLKSVIMSLPSTSAGNKASLASPQLLVARLAKGLDGITNPSARASVYWLVGQYAASDEKPAFGIGWEGIASWVPDILRKGAKGFTEESTTAKLQIITLLTKVMVLSPPNKQLGLLAQYLFSLARYDADYDVRDRARFLHALMRGVRDEKKSKDDEDPDTVDEVEAAEEQLGGVVLRREQVKVVVLGARDFGESNGFSGSSTEYQVGSMSRITQKRLTGYEEVPEWTDDPTDASLRESEIGTKSSAVTAPVAPVTAPTSSLPVPSVPTHLSSSPSVQRSSPSSNASPVGSIPTISHAASATNVKSKFKDLDKFLDSESETEEEDSEDDYSDDAAPAPAPVTAPPRSAIVPEYDTSSGESEEETDESDQEADGKENAPLYGQYR